MLPDQGPRGQLAEALPPCHGADSPAVLEEGRELRQPQEVNCGFWDVPSATRSQSPPNQAKARGCALKAWRWEKRKPEGPGAEEEGALESAL